MVCRRQHDDGVHEMKIYCTECGNKLRPLNYWEDDLRCRYVACKNVWSETMSFIDVLIYSAVGITAINLIGIVGLILT